MDSANKCLTFRLSLGETLVNQFPELIASLNRGVSWGSDLYFAMRTKNPLKGGKT
jgi:hypothetical protein